MNTNHQGSPLADDPRRPLVDHHGGDSRDPWNDPRITAYVLGELSAHQAEALEAQMRGDPALADAVDEARELTGQLQQWFADEQPGQLEPRRREQILASIDDSSAASSSATLPQPADRRGWATAPRILCGLVAAALLLGLGLWGVQRHPVHVASNFQSVDESRLPGSAAPAPQGPASGAQRSGQRGRQAEPPDAEWSLRYRSRELGETEPLAAEDELAPIQLGVAVDSESDSSSGLTDQREIAKQLSAPKSSLHSSERSSEVTPSEPLAAVAAEPTAGPAADRSGGDSRPLDRVEAPAQRRAEQQTRSRSREAEPYDGGMKADNMEAQDFEMEMDFGMAMGDRVATDADARDTYDDTGGMNMEMGYDMDSYGTDMGGVGGMAAGGRASQPGDNSYDSRPTRGVRRAPAGGSASSRYDDLASRGRRAPGTSAADRVAPVPRGERAVPELAESLGRRDHGSGPGMAGDRFSLIVDNAFRRPIEHPLSTFSIDVDTASYTKVRQYLVDEARLPRPDAVRIEELINYFDYDYTGPADDTPHPLATDVRLAECPWKPGHKLARIVVQSRRVAPEHRPAANLVFLVDTSGSMNQPNRFPLVRDGLLSLVQRLRDDDTVGIVTYAGTVGVALESTPGSDQGTIRRVIQRLQPAGSTNGGDGIRTAYQMARDHFVDGGINRVILCTDGDFNVGTTGTDELVRLVQQESRGGIDLTVLGFGMGNHNDAMLEQISGQGNGHYAFIDNQAEARRVLSERVTSTLMTIARDVKIQVEFNPRRVAAYRLIGYENRLLAKEDFNDDTKDAGEVGAGHSVTALYEIIPTGGDTETLSPPVDDLKYQPVPPRTAQARRQEAVAEPADRAEPVGEAAAQQAVESQPLGDASGGDPTDDEWMTVKLRYKPADAPAAQSQSVLIEAIARGDAAGFAQADPDFRFAALVAAFGMQLRASEYRGDWTLPDVQRVLDSLDPSSDADRRQFRDLVRRAVQLQASEDTRVEP